MDLTADRSRAAIGPVEGPAASVRDRLLGSGPALAGWLLPFSVVLVLGLKNGGYDVGIRSEVGIAIWWIILVGTASGMLTLRRVTQTGWVIAGVLAALAIWTGLAIGWSESAERSLVELGRVVTYLGVFVLALATQGRDGLRRTIAATGAAIAVIGIVALASRLHPDWFQSAVDDARQLPSAKTRLNYPLGYWNGLGALMAMGIPLLLVMALRARSIVGRVLAAAVVPVLALVAFYTLSRGAAIESGHRARSSVGPLSATTRRAPNPVRLGRRQRPARRCGGSARRAGRAACSRAWPTSSATR